MVVVGQDDAAAGPHRTHHAPDGAQRIAQMLQQEAGMGDVEGAPFALGQRRHLRLALPHLQQVRLAVLGRQRQRVADLLRTALDAKDLDAGRARHVARELAEAGAEIDDALALAELRRREATIVEQTVHGAEALLLGRAGAVRVVRGRHFPPPRMTQSSATIHRWRVKAKPPLRGRAGWPG